jgi:hypothetical protein
MPGLAFHLGRTETECSYSRDSLLVSLSDRLDFGGLEARLDLSEVIELTDEPATLCCRAAVACINGR